MKKIYNQPEVSVAQFASMSLMQAASPGNSMDLGSTITNEQW